MRAFQVEAAGRVFHRVFHRECADDSPMIRIANSLLIANVRTGKKPSDGSHLPHDYHRFPHCANTGLRLRISRRHKSEVMSARLLLRLATAFAVCGSALWAQAPRAPAPALIQARFNTVTDSLGFIWSVRNGGTVMVPNVINQSFHIAVDGDGVSFQREMMSADGQEYFFTANLDGLTITRRVRMNAKENYCRYFETITNTSSEARNLEFSINARTTGRMQVNGAAAGNRQMPLPDKDPGVILGAIQKPAGQPQPSIVWVLASPGAKVRPILQIEQGTEIKAAYPLVIPPGSSVSIAHAVAVRRLDPKTSGKKTAEVFAPMSVPRLLASLPMKERKDFGNYAPASGDGEEGGPGRLHALEALLEAADISRDKSDTVLLDAGSKVTGTVSGGALSIETEFGKAEIPWAEIAGIAGGAGAQRTTRVFLRDGEILAGAVAGEKMTMATDGGLTFEIALDRIDLLALRKGSGDGRPAEAAAALLTTQHGDCLAVARQPSGEIDVATPWGILRLPLSDVARLDYVREPFPGHVLTLTDGSRIPVMLRGVEWQLPTVRFGKVKIAPQSVREVRSTATKARPTGTDGADGEPVSAFCELSGEHRLAGVIDLAEIHLATAKITTPLDPKKISTLTRAGGEDRGALVKIKLADGQELSGQLVESTLPIRSGERVWRVPASHIVSVNVPPPAKPKDETPATPATPAKPGAGSDDIINAPPAAPPVPAPKNP